MRFVKESRTSQVVGFTVNDVRKKVEIIQNAWREYAKVNKIRWNQILNKWNVGVDTIEKKGRKLRINKLRRDECLQKYFMDKKREYSQNIRDYLNTSIVFYPIFWFIPSDTEIIKMINSLRR